MLNLLLLSSTNSVGKPKLAHAPLKDFYGDREVLLVPYAVSHPDAYSSMMADVFADSGVRCRSVLAYPDVANAVARSEAIYVAGGNTFRLLRTLQVLDLLDAIRARVHDGNPYGGASAGSNIVCPTIRTTNDMPVVEPDGLRSLNLLPFQINPHFQDANDSPMQPTTSRESRLEEFLLENDVAVIALREESWLRVEGSKVTLENSSARLFSRHHPRSDLPAGSDLSFLLQESPIFDSAENWE